MSLAELVAPHAGAWIETWLPLMKSLLISSSHPTRVRGLKQRLRAFMNDVYGVAPHAGAWIETARESNAGPSARVAPHAGAWIETAGSTVPTPALWVAPHAGAWIETQTVRGTGSYGSVAPHAGAWIETDSVDARLTLSASSHPTRVRGLKRAKRHPMARC